ncbi:hypothetical protein Ct61P_00968 [Colletotrichum tofieldiae]|nr:hypothetical protein Ct61P_00968 [Colletotrichum tofieldiae]
MSESQGISSASSSANRRVNSQYTRTYKKDCAFLYGSYRGSIIASGQALGSGFSKVSVVFGSYKFINDRASCPFP